MPLGKRQIIMSKRQAFIACASAKHGSERVIRAAKCIADDANAGLEVVTVLNDCTDREQMETVEYLYEKARSAGAQMTILYSDNPALAVAEYIKRRRITDVIAGTASEQNSDPSNFVSLVRAVMPKVRVILIPPLPQDSEVNVQLAVSLPPLEQCSAQARK